MSNNTSNKDKSDNATDTAKNKAVTAVEVVKGDTVVYEDGDFEDYNADKDYDADGESKSVKDKKDDTAAKSDKDEQADKASKSDKEEKGDKESKSDKEDSSDKSSKSKEEDKASKDDKGSKAEKDDSDKDDKDSNSDKDEDGNAEDKQGTIIANLYQWATKLKDDFISDKEDKSKSESAEKDGDDGDSKEKSESKSDSDKENKEDKHSATIANIYQWAAKLKDDVASEAASLTDNVSEKAVGLMLKRLLDGVETELQAFDKQAEESKDSDANSDDERKKISDKKDKYQSMIDLLQG